VKESKPNEVALYSSFFIAHSSLAVDSLLWLGMTKRGLGMTAQ
jgi:hypothetical protein